MTLAVVIPFERRPVSAPAAPDRCSECGAGGGLFAFCEKCGAPLCFACHVRLVDEQINAHVHEGNAVVPEIPTRCGWCLGPEAA